MVPIFRLASSKTSVTTGQVIIVWSNQDWREIVTVIWFNYNVNNHHAVTVVFEEAILKTGTIPAPEKWCDKFQYTRWRNSRNV